MSMFWKRIGNAEKSSKHNQLLPLEKHSRKGLLKKYIFPEDEKTFLSQSNGDETVSMKSHTIENFHLILKEYSRFPHFLDFLEVHEIETYAQCWSDCDKFSALCKKYENASRDCLEGVSEVCVSEYGAAASVTNDLPDLVSNISKNISVTPLSSPEEENSPVSQTLNPVRTLNIGEHDVSGREFSHHGYSDESDNAKSDSLQKRISDLGAEIFEKYIDSGNVTETLVAKFETSEILLKLNSNSYSSDLFTGLQNAIYQYMKEEYFPNYLQSEYFLKHQIEIFTSQNVCIQDILFCDSAIPYFMEYMEQEEALHLLEFWMSISNFKAHLSRQVHSHDYDADQAQSDAMVIYDKYFSLQATHAMGFSDRVRLEVESAICQDTGPSVDAFDVPAGVVLFVMHRDFLPTYLSSSFHIKFVGELINAIKLCSKSRQRSASSSTCLSEEGKSSDKASVGDSVSISRRNTLLAMDSSRAAGGGRVLRSVDDPALAMRIDSTQILDPDSLWRRKNFTKLSCGYVDELGRFESDMLPEPTQKAESKISKTLRKLVKFDEEKVKEDMAYRVAEMIIKDVTSVTLDPRRSSSSRGHQRNLSVDPRRSSSSRGHQRNLSGNFASTRPAAADRLAKSQSHQYLSSATADFS